MKLIIVLIAAVLVSCTPKSEEETKPHKRLGRARRSDNLFVLEKPIHLDGVKEYVSLGERLQVLTDVDSATLAAWIRPENLEKEVQYVIAIAVGSISAGTTSSRASLGIMKGGILQGMGRSTDTEKDRFEVKSKPATIQKNTWQHIATVIDYKNNQILLYVDGKLVVNDSPAPINFQQRITPRSLAMYGAIGSEDDGSNAYFSGDIQNVQVWGRALPASEIKSLGKKKPK